MTYNLERKEYIATPSDSRGQMWSDQWKSSQLSEFNGDT